MSVNITGDAVDILKMGLVTDHYAESQVKLDCVDISKMLQIFWKSEWSQGTNFDPAEYFQLQECTQPIYSILRSLAVCD